jgi:hypothetical protein
VSTCWSKADLHVHTTYSDGASTVAEVLRYAAEHTDLRVVAITDHDTIDGAIEAQRLASAYGVEVVVGEEISTREGHLLALFIERRIAPGHAAAETIAEIHAQGGLAIPAHPYDWATPSLGRGGLRERASSEWPVDGIECFNASLWPRRSNGEADAVARKLAVGLCGGSDSHSAPTLGCGYTLFPGSSTADLRQAILARTTQSGGRRWPYREIATVGARLMQRECAGFFGRRLLPS